MTHQRLPVLYSFRRCPYAMRARMAIHIAGLQLQTIEVELKNKPQSLLDYSPKGTVPVVVTADGKVIDESRDIMLWALQQSDPEDWLLQANLRQQQVMTELVDSCDTQFKPLLDRYKYADRYPELTPAEHRTAAEFFLQALDDRLSNQQFLMDEQMRFVDVAIFPFIRQFAGVNTSWFQQSPYSHLASWLDKCTSSALFKKIMEKK